MAFDSLLNLLTFSSAGFPVLPWLFGARWGRRGGWLGAGLAVAILLGVFPVWFWLGCGDCGQGAIAIFVLLPIWFGSAVLTIASAALAHVKFARS